MKKIVRFLWRCQPNWLRRWELNTVSACLGHRLDPQRPLLPGPVIVVGYFGTASGLGEVARHTLRRIQESGVESLAANVSPIVAREDFTGGDLWPANAPGGGIVIFHVNPDVLVLVQRALGRKRLDQRKIIGCWAWELDVVPQQWLRSLQYVDEVWAPSHFIAQALRKAAPGKPIHVVPYPMHFEDRPTAPKQDPLPEYSSKTIVFFMYDVRSVHARKNPEAVIEAFCRAVEPRHNAVLVIKVSGAETWPDALSRLHQAIAGRTDIHILQKTLSADAMRDLIARVDIVMSLHRSEGFGLLMAEAMAAAKPVIATGWSGNLDFMTPDCSILIDAKLVPVVDPQNIYNHYDASWANPDINQAAAALRTLLEKPEERLRLGQAARAHILRFFSQQAYFHSLPSSFWNALTPQAQNQKKRLLS